jgi:hypothetical protein
VLNVFIDKTTNLLDKLLLLEYYICIMSTSAKNKVIEEIRRDLFSGEDLVVMKAVKKCEDLSAPQLVEPLIAVFATTDNIAIKQEVGEMLGSLKVSNTEDYFFNALRNKEFRNVRRELLSFIWNSGIQPAGEVVFLTELAIDGSYEEALECLTIIEEIEEGIPEDHLLEASSIARAFITTNKDHEKVHLIADLLVAIEGRQELED